MSIWPANQSTGVPFSQTTKRKLQEVLNQAPEYAGKDLSGDGAQLLVKSSADAKDKENNKPGPNMYPKVDETK